MFLHHDMVKPWVIVSKEKDYYPCFDSPKVYQIRFEIITDRKDTMHHHGNRHFENVEKDNEEDEESLEVYLVFSVINLSICYAASVLSCLVQDFSCGPFILCLYQKQHCLPLKNLNAKFRNISIINRAHKNISDHLPWWYRSMLYTV